VIIKDLLELAELYEVKKPTKTKDDEVKTADIDLDGPADAKLPASKEREAPKEPKGDKSKPRSMGDTASKSETRSRTSGINLPMSAHDHLRNLHQNIRTEDGVPEPETPTTDLALIKPRDLPKVITKEMTHGVTPQWHMVKNLPGYMQQGIRRLGRAVFNEYTRTPIDEIQVLAIVSGHGPNTEREVNAVAKWAMDDGVKATTGEINFDHVMPGYKAKVQIHNAEGVQVMMVIDDYGKYIYAWPEADSKLPDHSSQKKLGSDTKKLK
jgi:hypothetical protein